MRTIQIAPVQSKFNNKWSCVFQTYRTYNGDEVLMSEAESAPVWDTAGEAEAAGVRALEHLEFVDAWPNMCERW